MACLSGPHISLATLPGLGTTLPGLSFSPIVLSSGFCCQFEQVIPIPGIPGIPLPGPIVVLLAALNAVIQEAIAALNLVLDHLTFNCPLD